jgi:hypothetical protein
LSDQFKNFNLHHSEIQATSQQLSPWNSGIVCLETSQTRVTGVDALALVGNNQIVITSEYAARSTAIANSAGLPLGDC